MVLSESAFKKKKLSESKTESKTETVTESVTVTVVVSMEKFSKTIKK